MKITVIAAIYLVLDWCLVLFFESDLVQCILHSLDTTKESKITSKKI